MTQAGTVRPSTRVGRLRTIRATPDGPDAAGAAAPRPDPVALPPPFDALERTAANHFDLWFFAAIVRLHELAPTLADVSALAFLRAYVDQLPAWARDGSGEATERWWAAIRAWEARGAGHLPIGGVRDGLGLDAPAITALFVTGLAEEDGRFGAVFQALQSGAGHRPTVTLLAGLAGTTPERSVARASVRDLLRVGLLEPVATAGPRGEWAMQPAAVAWSALRGDASRDVAPWAAWRTAADAMPLADVVVSDAVRAQLAAIPTLLASGGARAIVARGPGASGRRTVLAALAKASGLGTLEAAAADLDDVRARQLGVLAAALDAMPVVRIAPGPGEVVELPALGGYRGPLGVTIPMHGSVRGPDLETAVAVTLASGDAAERRRHWRAALGEGAEADLDELAGRYRMTGGSIRRAGPLAIANARLAGHAAVTPDDVLVAGRALRSPALERLAAWVPPRGEWSDLVVGEETAAELRHLEARCRARERLAALLPPVIGLRTAGVRVLFTGPSGTGKTLAARVLASVLGLDLYVVELSSVVDKFLGETEKNLTELFARAAELDAVLLVDEGDALLTGRTDVRSSNDRYANLQTNHLLQVLEAHDGIVVITTNAGDRIDGAFQRRMDSTVEFRMPEPDERWRLWDLHLGPGHGVDPGVLAEIAARCALSGAQVRNAVLHAWLVAHAEDDATPVVRTRHLDAAVRREYRKAGATCPLPATLGAGA